MENSYEKNYFAFFLTIVFKFIFLYLFILSSFFLKLAVKQMFKKTTDWSYIYQRKIILMVS